MKLIRTDTKDDDFDLLNSCLVGKKLRNIQLETGCRYTSSGDNIDKIVLFFEDGSRFQITQNTDPIDDEEEHDINPLMIELTQG